MRRVKLFLASLLTTFFLITLNERGEAGAGDSGNQGDSGNDGDGGDSGNQDQDGAGDSGNQGDKGDKGDQGSGNQDVTSLPDWAQKLVKGLRQENADRRTKSNNLETRLDGIEKGFKSMFGDGDNDDDTTPEQRLHSMTTAHDEAIFQNALLGIAMENGIGNDQFEYFSFLMDKAANGLKEGEEVSEEALADIIKKASSKGAANSSVDGEGGGDGNRGGSETTIDQFVNMSMMDKNKLYRENKDLYTKLFAEAKSKNLLKG